MKLFLDDMRALPGPEYGVGFVLCKSGEEFYELVCTPHDTFDEFWFDHDLGASKYNGHQCLEMLIEECELHGYPKPKTIVIHTSNTWEMRAMGQRVERYFGPGVLRYENGLYMPLREDLTL